MNEICSRKKNRLVHGSITPSDMVSSSDSHLLLVSFVVMPCVCTNCHYILAPISILTMLIDVHSSVTTDKTLAYCMYVEQIEILQTDNCNYITMQYYHRYDSGNQPVVLYYNKWMEQNTMVVVIMFDMEPSSYISITSLDATCRSQRQCICHMHPLIHIYCVRYILL